MLAVNTAAVRVLVGCRTAESWTGLKQATGFLGMCSLAAIEPVPTVKNNSAFIDSEQAAELKDFIAKVAPGLTDKGKIYNLTSAVFRRFCLRAALGPPKANVDGSVYTFNVPEISWMVGAEPPATPQRLTLPNTACSRYNGAIPHDPQSPHITRQLDKAVTVHADTPQEATEAFHLSLLRSWVQEGLLESSKNSLAIPTRFQPLPVAIKYPEGDQDQELFYQSHVDDSQLSRMSQIAWEASTHVVASSAEAQDVVKRILGTAEKSRARGGDPRERVLGFDIEFKPRWNASLPESPPTVIQVATEEEVFVFHVKHFAAGVRVGADSGVIQRALQPLLPLFTSQQLLKVGVGVDGDASMLQRFSPNLKCRGFHDMAPVATGAGFKRHSLRALSALLLGHSISKKQQMSNWDKARLSEAQVVYAATDAWISREIALKLAPLWLQQAAT